MRPGLAPGRTVGYSALRRTHVAARQCGPGQARCHVQRLAASKAGKQAKTARAKHGRTSNLRGLCHSFALALARHKGFKKTRYLHIAKHVAKKAPCRRLRPYPCGRHLLCAELYPPFGLDALTQRTRPGLEKIRYFFFQPLTDGGKVRAPGLMSNKSDSEPKRTSLTPFSSTKTRLCLATSPDVCQGGMAQTRSATFDGIHNIG